MDPLSFGKESQNHLRICGFNPEISFHVLVKRDMALHRKIPAVDLKNGMTAVDLLYHPALEDLSNMEPQGILF